MLEKLLGNKSAYWVMLYLYHYGEVYPSLIADSLGTSLNPIKGQLKKLSDAGILSRKKMGKMKIGNLKLREFLCLKMFVFQLHLNTGYQSSLL